MNMPIEEEAGLTRGYEGRRAYRSRRCRWRRIGIATLLGAAMTMGATAAELTPTDFTKRMTITFAGYDPTGSPDETLTNFPVLVVLSNSVDGSDFSYDDFSGTTG